MSRRANRVKHGHASSELFAASCERRGVVVWTPDRVVALRAAYRKGGLRAAEAALPEFSPSAINNAVARYGSEDLGEPKPLLGRDAVRARIEAIPLGELCARLSELLVRRADFDGAA